MRIFAERAWLPSGWADRVGLTLRNGRIADIDTGGDPHPDARRTDTLLPALSNLHSHAFQRAMAGLTEIRAPGRDSFWAWRNLMYRFLDRLTPDHLSAIAEMAFAEMLEAGYAAVGEFHYLHHAPGGAAYEDPAELSQRMLAAAQATGLGITHLPVFYARAGVGGQALTGGQLRFGSDLERYLDLLARCRAGVNRMADDTGLGIAPHSLRAVSPGDLSALLAAAPAGPVHIHIAEQTREVDDVLAGLGARPVAWLLDNAEVTGRWCLIHATHMTPDEVAGMARSGAVAGLCPVTEANLGDGVFPGAAYQAAGGAFGVGTDSNVSIALTDELRLLEYSQRLTRQARNVMVPGEGSVGRALYLGAAAGGAQALGRDAGAIEPGRLADLMAIDSGDARLCHLSGDGLFDGLVFAAGDRVVTDVWSAGRHQVQGGRHIDRDAIAGRFRRVMEDVTGAL